MTAHLVSVLMSVHNGSQYLREAVDSILHQTFRDFEFIVVDDGSTDDSLLILESYEDPRLHIIRQSKNQGLVAALNLAAKVAKAPLLARMDADDVALPERLRLQTDAFAAQPDLVLLGTAYNVIDSAGKFIGCQSLPEVDAEIRTGLIEGNKFAHPTVMMRANAFHVCGGYRNIGGRYAQDYDLWLRLAEYGQMGNLDTPLLCYRVHEQQVSIAKLFLQREAAELYCQLALQRKYCGHEDVDKARAVVISMHGKLREDCAAELLRLSSRFSRDGKKRDALKLRWRAICMAPFSKPVWSDLVASIYWQMIRIFTPKKL